MSMIDELAKALKAVNTTQAPYANEHVTGLCHTAAARIEALETEMAVLVDFLQARKLDVVAARAIELLGRDRLDGEIWKPIDGHPNYEVSSIGRVRSKPRKRTPGGILKLTLRPGGYLRVNLGRGYENKCIMLLVHRLVLTAFGGPPPTPNHHAAHINGVATDNRIENLRWATPAENAQDKILHGTVRRGSTATNRKLTAKAVEDIRQSKGKVSQGELAARYNVGRTCIQRVQGGQSWKTV